MAARSSPRILLIGGGLAGGLLATYLGRRGYEVRLFERRPDPSAGQFVGGRSINLAVSTRGIDALERAGLADAVMAHAIPMGGRMIHGPSGDLHFQPYDKDPGRRIHSIGRASLNSVTLAAAQALPGVSVRFNRRCVDVDLDRPAARLVDAVGGGEEVVEGDLVIGVDGAFSAVRRAMQRLERFDYSQEYLRHGYKELCIPPAADGSFALDPHALHIWPRRRFMMIALPNPDRSFTCTLFWPFEGPQSFASVRSDADVVRFFEVHFRDALPLMPALVEDFRRNPTGSMVTVRCRPWHHAGRVALVGDAAHAVVPFYGQGMNASFEDVVVLDECLARHGSDLECALVEYEAARKPNTDALADLAIGNFLEMRDKTASRAFRAGKRLERMLHRALPWWYTPLYTLVSFTRTPYGEAVARARRQDRVVRVAAALAAAVLLAALMRLWTGERAVLCAYVSATIVYVALQLVSRRKARESAAGPAGGRLPWP